MQSIRSGAPVCTCRRRRRVDAAQPSAVKHRQDRPALVCDSSSLSSAAHICSQDGFRLHQSVNVSARSQNLLRCRPQHEIHVQKTATSCFAVYASCAVSDVQFRRLCTRRLLSPSSCHGSTTAMLWWWAYQATCTAAYNRYSTLPRDQSLTCGARTTSPTHSPVSTG